MIVYQAGSGVRTGLPTTIGGPSREFPRRWQCMSYVHLFLFTILLCLKIFHGVEAQTLVSPKFDSIRVGVLPRVSNNSRRHAVIHSGF